MLFSGIIKRKRNDYLSLCPFFSLLLCMYMCICRRMSVNTSIYSPFFLSFDNTPVGYSHVSQFLTERKRCILIDLLITKIVDDYHRIDENNTYKETDYYIN